MLAGLVGDISTPKSRYGMPRASTETSTSAAKDPSR